MARLKKKHKRSENELTEVHVAIIKDDMSILKNVIKQYPHAVNEQDELGFTPLHVACALGNFNAVKLLLSKKADPNIRDLKNRNALHAAVFSQDEMIIDLLLKYKADIKTQSLGINNQSYEDLFSLDTTDKPHVDGPPFKKPMAADNRPDFDVKSTKQTLVSLLSSKDATSQLNSSVVGIPTIDTEPGEIDDTELGTVDGTEAGSDSTIVLEEDQSTPFDSLEPFRSSDCGSGFKSNLATEREYFEFMRKKNLDLLSKKLKSCAMLEERMRYVIDEFEKVMDESRDFPVFKDDDSRFLDDDATKQLVRSLRSEITKLVEKNRRLERVIKKQFDSSNITTPEKQKLEVANQDLFIQALSSLLHENFTLRAQLETANSGKAEFSDTIDSCTTDVRQHYDLSESDKSSSESFFHKLMRKKRKER